MLREYGRNLLVINTLAGKAAPPRPGQDTELSLCDGKPWEISVSIGVIHGLTKKKKKVRWATGWKLHSQSKHGDGALGYGTANQMMAWAEFCSARVKTDGGNVIYCLG